MTDYSSLSSSVHRALCAQGFIDEHERDALIECAENIGTSPIALGQFYIMLTTMTPEEFKRKSEEIHRTVERMKKERRDD